MKRKFADAIRSSSGGESDASVEEDDSAGATVAVEPERSKRSRRSSGAPVSVTTAGDDAALGAATMSLLMRARVSAEMLQGHQGAGSATAAALQAQVAAQQQAHASFLAALMSGHAPGGMTMMPTHWAAAVARSVPYGSVFCCPCDGTADPAAPPSVLCRPKPARMAVDKDAFAAAMSALLGTQQAAAAPALSVERPAEPQAALQAACC